METSASLQELLSSPTSFLLPLLLLLLPPLLWLLLHRSSSFFASPLNRLPPGPFALPFFGHWPLVSSRITARKMATLSKHFGDIFLLKMGRRNLVVLHSPQLAKEMLHTHGVQFGSRFSNVVLDIFTGSGQDLAFAEYGDHWRKARRILTLPFFTQKAVQQWRTSWAAEMDSMLQRLANKPEAFQADQGVLIRESLHLLIYNNLYMIAFGRRFENEDDPLYLQLKALNEERGRLVQSLDYNLGDFHPIFEFFVRHYLNTCRRVKAGREKLFKHLISERMQSVMMGTPGSTSQAGDRYGIDHLLAAVKGGEITDENVLYLLENLNAAGIDTVLFTLEWMIAELVNNPHVQDKLYADVMRSNVRDEDFTHPDCNKLHYLQAFIKETMRIHTTVPLIVPHMNLEPAKLGGYDIPARSKVIVNQWWLANNPEWWRNPEEFNPERFLGEEKTVELRGNDFKFLPFGAGRRQCPGMVTALPMIRLVIGKLVQKFQLLPPAAASTHKKQQQLDLTERETQFLAPMAVPPRVLLKLRSETSNNLET